MAAAIAAMVAFAMLVPGIGEPGLWSDGELPALDRVLAALGEAKTGLLRSPPLPDWLRTRSWSLFGNEAGLRLPHALAVVVIVAGTAALAARRGASRMLAVIAGLVALSMPALALGGRTAIGDPFAEAFAVVAILAALAAVDAEARARKLALAVASAAAVLAAIASAGLVLGGCLPLFAIALLLPPTQRRVQLGLGVAIAVAGLVALALALRQGDGYIPLLGAAKDLELIDKPEARRFIAALADLGHQSFPWLPLGLVGAALGRDRVLALWLCGGLAIATWWSLAYGTIDIPLRVPVALACIGALELVATPERARALRRGIILLAALGILALAKDLELVPEQIAAPLQHFAVNEYPGERLETAARFGRWAKWVVLALVGALVLSGHDERPGPFERVLARIPRQWRAQLGPALVGVVALGGAWMQSHPQLAKTSDMLSPKRVLATYDELLERGALTGPLAAHRVRDRGLAYYGPPDVAPLAGRRDIFTWLAEPDPRATLLRDIDVSAVHQHRRANGLPTHVLDDSHARLRLVTNFLPEGMVDRNRIPEVLFDEPPVLEHETLVRFEQFVEVIGWEIDEPVVRGRKTTLKLALKVLRPMPGGAKIFARLLGGKLSRINPDPQPLAEDLYPCNLWRPGDYILHRYTFEAPLVEIVPGEHDFVIGLRRGETKNFEISVPEGPDGEHGVHIDDPKRAFAKLGTVQVY